MSKELTPLERVEQSPLDKFIDKPIESKEEEDDVTESKH